MASWTAKTNRLPLSAAKRVCLLAGALLLVHGTVSAASFDEERKALAHAKAQAVVAAERAERITRQAEAEANEADAAQRQAAALGARIQATEADLSAAEARIRLVEKMRIDQRARLAAQQEPVARLLAAVQMLARRPTGMIFLQPGGTRDAVRLRAVLAHIVPVLRKRTAGLRAEIARGAQLREDARKATLILETARQRLDAQRKELAVLAETHRKAASQLKGSALAEEDRAIGYGEEARDIAGLMRSLEANAGEVAALAALPGPVLRPGSGSTPPEPLANGAAGRLPYRLPVTGTLVAGLGDISESGARSRGISIAPRGEALVAAPSDGRVVFAGPFKGYGRIVILDHGVGWTSLITGMDTLYVKVGDQLVQGGPMGRAASMRPQVTVELRHNGKPADITRLVG